MEELIEDIATLRHFKILSRKGEMQKKITSQILNFFFEKILYESRREDIKINFGDRENNDCMQDAACHVNEMCHDFLKDKKSYEKLVVEKFGKSRWDEMFPFETKKKPKTRRRDEYEEIDDSELDQYLFKDASTLEWFFLNRETGIEKNLQDKHRTTLAFYFEFLSWSDLVLDSKGNKFTELKKRFPYLFKEPLENELLDEPTIEQRKKEAKESLAFDLGVVLKSKTAPPIEKNDEESPERVEGGDTDSKSDEDKETPTILTKSKEKRSLKWPYFIMIIVAISIPSDMFWQNKSEQIKKDENTILIYKYHKGSNDKDKDVEENLRQYLGDSLMNYNYTVVLLDSTLNCDNKNQARLKAREKGKKDGAEIVIWGSITDSRVRTQIEYLSPEARRIIKSSKIEFKDFIYERGKYNEEIFAQVSLLAKSIICFDKFYNDGLNEAVKFLSLIKIDEIKKRAYAVLLMKMKFFSEFSLAIENNFYTDNSYLEKASNQLNEILKEESSDQSFPYFYLAVIEVIKGDINKAIKDYKKVIDLNSPYRDNANHQLGHIYLENPSISLGTTINNSKYGRNNYLKINNKGISNLDSVVHYWKNLPFNRKYGDQKLSLGKMYKNRGETKKAIDCYEGYLKLHPSDYRCMGEIFPLYFQIGETIKGNEYYSKYVCCNPLLKSIWFEVEILKGEEIDGKITVNLVDLLRKNYFNSKNPIEIEELLNERSDCLLYFHILNDICLYNFVTKEFILVSHFLTENEIIAHGIHEITCDFDILIDIK